MQIVGLISGTSVDGIDAALVEVDGHGYEISVNLLAALTHPYPPDLRQKILNLCAGQPTSLPDLAGLDDALGLEFARAAQAVMDHGTQADLIASHGQTVYHRPAGSSSNGCDLLAPNASALGYSLQLGRGSVIAHHLGLPTVSDFRRADIEAGGQGAPLVPLVDMCLFSQPKRTLCIQNIGGIGNVAYLPPWDRSSQPLPPKVLGWDTGPGNSLIDIAVHYLSEGTQSYDRDGAWASQGQVSQDLVDQWLTHPYFAQLPPKSTGRELFGWEFFHQCYAQAQQYQLSAADLIASLTEFTAVSIAQSYRNFSPTQPDQVLVCGGGSYNPVLLDRLQAHLGPARVTTTDAVGVSAAFKEAIAFAVLGFWHWQQVPSNLPDVTGAKAAVVLGYLNRP